MELPSSTKVEISSPTLINSNSQAAEQDSVEVGIEVFRRVGAPSVAIPLRAREEAEIPGSTYWATKEQETEEKQVSIVSAYVLKTVNVCNRRNVQLQKQLNDLSRELKELRERERVLLARKENLKKEQAFNNKVLQRLRFKPNE